MIDVTTSPNSKTLPLTPTMAIRLAAERNNAMPDEVIVTCNDLIVEHMKDGYASIPSGDLHAEISRACDVPASHVVNGRWVILAIEMYRSNGWTVTYSGDNIDFEQF